MAVQESVCHTSQPPEGFSDVVWKNICKTPCSDVLMCWLSQQLVDQDMGEVCDVLSIDKTDSLKAGSGSGWKIRDVLSAWLGKRGDTQTTYLSELVLPLSALHIKNLDADTLNEKAIELGGHCSGFEYDGASKPVGVRSDSGVEESTLKPLRSYPPAPIECTNQGDGYDGLFALPIQEEETSMRILSELVTGGMQHFKHSSHKPSYKIDRQKIRALRVELRDLQNEFASLLQHVCDELGRNEATVKKLRVFLTQRCVDTHNKIPHFPTFMIEIMNMSTFEEVFAHLSRIGAWHFLSYLILKDVFVLFQNISPELHTQLDEYNAKIEGFKQKTLLMDFLAVWGGRYDKDEDLPCSRSVIVKSIGDPFSFTIADACDKAGLIAGEFSLKDLGILADGSTGSIYIKWLVSPAAAKHILEVMKSEKRPDLLQFGVLQLAVERTVFKSKYRYESIYKLSLNNPRLFWGGVGAKELVWRKHSREVFTHSKETGKFHWFKDAHLNVSENCLDHHVADKVALIWEKDDGDTKEVTYGQLLDQTCRVANVLKKRGINKGDVVVICMPTMPLAVASMLACARIGAVHCVVFSDFNEDVLRQRIKEVKAKAVITADIRVIGGKTRNLKEKIARALSSVDTSVQFVLVAKRNDISSEAAEDITIDSDGFYFLLENEMQEVPPDCDPVPMDGEDILFIAYTSGSQIGTSKAVYHTQAGYLLYTKLTYQFMFNLAPDDIMGCVSDLGWIAAHCYVVYGPLSNGNTTLLFESTATHPNEGRYWEMIDKHKLTHFYTTPSVLKELMIREKRGAGQINKYDLSSLKVIASGGEPIPLDIEQWYYTMIGKEDCLFLDTWGQTELGGTGIVRWEAPEAKERSDFPSSKSFALFGVEPHTMVEGRSELFLKHPLPGMGKFTLVSGDSVKIPYEQQHYKNIGPKEQEEKHTLCGYATDDILECEQGTGLFRVIARKDRTAMYQGAQGVWYLSLAEIENCLRTTHAGTDICDAQVVSCQKSSDEPDSLCVVLQTPSSVEYKNKDMAYFYSVSAVAAVIRDILKGLVIRIYFLSLAESAKIYLQTATQKTSLRILKNFLISREQSLSNDRKAKGWEEIKETEFLTFCKNNSSLMVAAQ